MSVVCRSQCEERSMAIHLILISLAEEEVQLTVDPQEHDALRENENAVLEQIPELGRSSTSFAAS